MWAVLGHAFSVGVCLWVSKPGKSLVLEKVTYLYECVRLGKGFSNFSHGQSDLTTKSYHFIMQGIYVDVAVLLHPHLFSESVQGHY